MSRPRRWCALVALCVMVSSASFAEPQKAGLGAALSCPLEPGRRSFALEVEGRERGGRLEVGPKAGLDGAAPVLLLFHGWGGYANGFLDTVDVSRVWPEAVVIAPTGLPRRFPGLMPRSHPGWQIAKDEFGDRDLELFDALLAAVEALPCLDATRVTSSGFSNGGFFVNLLGCERSAKLAAIAAVAGGGPTGACADALPAWVGHGDRDRVVKPREGRRSFESWQRTNACEATGSESDSCVAAAGCARETVMCRHPGRHNWPRPLTGPWVDFLRRQSRSAKAPS